MSGPFTPLDARRSAARALGGSMGAMCSLVAIADAMEAGAPSEAVRHLRAVKRAARAAYLDGDESAPGTVAQEYAAALEIIRGARNA